MIEREHNVNTKNFFEILFDFLNIFHQRRIINYIKNLNLETVIDIGAHNGDFANNILEIKSIKKIFCFEPQRKIFCILSKKFKKNKKIFVFNNALDKIKSKKIMYINKNSYTSTLCKYNNKSLYLKFRNLLQNCKDNYLYKNIVKTNTLDSIFIKKKKLKNILLKIDVEGYEINVLKGGKKMMKKIKYILIEHQFANHNINSKIKVIKFLKKNNFKKIKNFIYPMLNFSDVLYKKS